MYHLMLCDEFGAEEAYRIGLVQEVVAPGTQLAQIEVIARRRPVQNRIQPQV